MIAVFKWPIGQAVKTSPFHGGNTGSIPVWVILLKGVTKEKFFCNTFFISENKSLKFFDK